MLSYRLRWQAEHGRWLAATLAPWPTAPQLVGYLRNVETEVARRPLRGETQGHALGDVFLLAGTEAQHRNLTAAVHAFQALELCMQQLHSGRRRRVVVVHHPDVFGAIGQRGFYADCVTVGRTAVFRQLYDPHASGPAFGELIHRGSRGVADDQHFVDFGKAQGIADQLFEVTQAIAVGHGDDGRPLFGALLRTREHFEVGVAVDEDCRVLLPSIDHVAAFA